jgi:hypothetical protein
MKTGLAAVIIAGLVTSLSARATPVASVAPTPAPAPTTSGLPELQCVKMAIKEIGNRLLQTPGSGPAISYTNDGFLGHEDVPGIDRARVGDPVLMCLISIPKQLGDTRGRIYTVTDLRTQESWTLADSPHACGGA